MDKYNIIIPTNNLEDLNKDLENWYLLPLSMRLKSDGDCYDKYGCSVLDLYEKIKAQIMNSQDARNADYQSNLIKEDIDINSDRFIELKTSSGKLQQDPYIVIIDPDCSSIKELDIKFDNFNSLNSKNRRLSNDYSEQLWGKDVINMYQDLFNKFSDNSDEFMYESKYDKYERVINILERGYIDNIDNIKGIIIESELYNNSNDISASSAVYNAVYSKVLSYKNDYNKFDSSILSECSFLTPYDIKKNNINYTGFDRSKISVLKEAYNDNNKDSILSMGYPNIKNLSSESFIKLVKEGKEIQSRFIEDYLPKVFDISDIKLEDTEINSINTPVCPVFFIFNRNPKIESELELPKTEYYTKVGLAFNTSIDSINTFNGVDRNFNGFIKETLSDYDNIDIMMILVDEEGLRKLSEFNDEITDNYFNTPMSDIFAGIKNKNSDDSLKVVYMMYIYNILNIMNINNNIYKLPGNNYIYKIYSGNSDLYDSTRTEYIINTVLDDKYRAKIINSLSNGDSFVESALSDILNPKYTFIKI